MHDDSPPVAVDPITGLLSALADTLARQRAVLEAGQLDQLGEINTVLESRYAAIGNWPGGEPALVEAIAAQPEAARASLRNLLLQVGTDNRVNGDLIRLTMNRVAAIQAFQAAGSPAGTYGPGAGAGAGSRLSRRA